MKVTQRTAILAPMIASIVSLVGVFSYLFLFVSTPSGVSRAGVYIGIYGLVAAFYIQFSPYSVYRDIPDRHPDPGVPLTLFALGAATVFHSVNAETLTVPVPLSEPHLTMFANAMVVAVVSGWVVQSHMITWR